MTQKIAIYVQHLLGAGHLVRAMSLAEALSEHGYRVLLLSGGFPIERSVEGYGYFQLPPTRAIDGDFTRLVDERDKAIDEAWRNSRAAMLIDELTKFEPDLVITEAFPFGRRQFRFELEPLINWVREQASVYLMASIRDVLQRRSDAKNRLSVETIEQYYDAVLVHADNALFDLNASFPLSHEIEHKLIYTGYIHQSANKYTPLSTKKGPLVDAPGLIHPTIGSPFSGVEASTHDGYDEIIVSGGSGTVSTRLIEVARQARPLSAARERVWRLLTGRDQSRVVSRPQTGLILEPNRADFYTLLSRCALSISQAGYNTTLDVLASGARSVMVPFSGQGETEQYDRAQALERAGRLIMLPEPELTPQNLAHAVDRALEMQVKQFEVDLHGARNSARLISQKLEEWSA